MADQQEKEATPAKAATEKAEAKAPAAKAASVEQPGPAGTRAAPQGSEPGLAPGEASPSVAQEVRPRAMVYIGPARPFGVPLMPHAILRGEPVTVFPALEKPMQDHPALARLFVPVADLARARQELANAGSGLAITYRNIQTASAKTRKA